MSVPGAQRLENASAAVRLSVFAIVLAITFAAAWAAGDAFGPTIESREDASHAGHAAEGS